LQSVRCRQEAHEDVQKAAHLEGAAGARFVPELTLVDAARAGSMDRVQYRLRRVESAPQGDIPHPGAATAPAPWWSPAAQRRGDRPLPRAPMTWCLLASGLAVDRCCSPLVSCLTPPWSWAS